MNHMELMKARHSVRRFLDKPLEAEAIQVLSDIVGADMSEAKVCALEFGTNFLLRHEVGQYLNRLADCPRLQRESILGSVYYQGRGKEENRTKVYAFYNKAAEIERKGGTIPDNLQGRNFLRYEIRIKKRLNQFFNDDVTGGKLSDKEFYKGLVAKYKEIYFSINKKSINNDMDKSKIKTVSDAFSAFVGQMIARGDKKDVEQFINDLRANGVFKDRVSYLRLKKMFEACEGYMINGKDELIQELDNEVKNVCAYS